MASEYSRVIAFSGSSSAVQSLELPAPTQGVLERVIITQTNSDVAAGSGTFKIYDRKSACIGLTDINVTASGAISSIAVSTTGFVGVYDNGADYSPGDVVAYSGTSWVRVTGPNPGYPPVTGDANWTPSTSGKLTIVFSAPHNLKIGDSFFIKDCATSVYNATYVVTNIVSTTSVTVSSLLAAETANSGVWQTLPFNPRTSPPTSLIYSGTVAVSTTFEGFNLNRVYENKDNQDFNLRCRNSALWLEFTPTELTPAKVLQWEIAYTCRINPYD